MSNVDTTKPSLVKMRPEKLMIKRLIAVNFYNTLLAISAVECDKFHQGLRAENFMFKRWIAVNFYNTLLVI